MAKDPVKDVIHRLAAASSEIVLAAIRYSDHGGTIRALFTLNIDGSPKPVLLIGSAHGSHKDGEVIAILNPDHELLDRLQPGLGYSGGLLKEIVTGRCDAMVRVWIEAYRKDPSSIIDRYRPRAAAATAKFEVR